MLSRVTHGEPRIDAPPPIRVKDFDRLRRWVAAGRPPIPLFTDRDGTVTATARNLAPILAGTNPKMDPFREAASRWIDRNLREA